MLDIRYICENIKEVEKALKKRGCETALDKLILLDEKRRKTLVEVESLKHTRNETSESISRLKKEKKDAEKLIRDMQKVSGEIKDMDERVRDAEKEIRDFIMMLPNLPDESVPAGKSPADNRVVREEGKRKQFDFEPREHWEIGETLDILDIPGAVDLAQTRFVLLKGKGALIERSLITFMLETHIGGGYLEILPPVMVNEKTMTGTGQLPKFREELYRCQDDDLYLIPTAEVPLTNLARDRILNINRLPLKYVAYTPCFRREAGSYGKDTKGLIRNHQFNKVELVKFSKPENSGDELEKLLGDAEKVLKLLGIPYRVVLLCSADMGFAASKTYDLEVWMPGEKKWREVSSCSNFTDFQARRMNIKYKKEDSSAAFVHTLNGSGLAVGRTFAALLENYQTKEGAVIIPEALRPYTAGLEKIEK